VITKLSEGWSHPIITKSMKTKFKVRGLTIEILLRRPPITPIMGDGLLLQDLLPGMVAAPPPPQGMVGHPPHPGMVARHHPLPMVVVLPVMVDPHRNHHPTAVPPPPTDPHPTAVPPPTENPPTNPPTAPTNPTVTPSKSASPPP